MLVSFFTGWSMPEWSVLQYLAAALAAGATLVAIELGGELLLADDKVTDPLRKRAARVGVILVVALLFLGVSVWYEWQKLA